MSAPFLPCVRVERGGFPESRHDGLLVVVNEDGALLSSWGDPDWPVFVRSSLKMVQALPLVESGAAAAFGIDARLLALCCASHGGEPFHVDGVREILAHAGVPEESLHCGAHAPLHRPSADALVAAGEEPAPIHNNCSGKHAGMLATCAHRGWPTDGYWRPDHPLQREIAAALARRAGLPPEALTHGVDGCGVPAFRLPLAAFARAVAGFASASADAAAGEIFAAMSAHSDMVGGTGRFCTELPRATGRPVLAKGGAEGVYVAAWRGDDGRGVALAVKAACGASRASQFIAAEAMDRLGLLTEDGRARLAPFHRGPLRNHAGEPIGRLVALFERPQPPERQESGTRRVAGTGPA